jgi:ADP-heptose:LPS heptosyltransferase
VRYAYKSIILASFLRLLDACGALCSVFFRKHAPGVLGEGDAILVIRLDHIGDFVLTTPVFANLKKAFPRSLLCVVVQPACAPLARRNPHIDDVLEFSPRWLRSTAGKGGFFALCRQIRRRRFAWGLDPRGDLFSILILWLGGVRFRAGFGITGGSFLLTVMAQYPWHETVVRRNLSLLQAIGVPCLSTAPEVFCHQEDEAKVRLLWKEYPLRRERSIAVHCDAGTQAKEWPDKNLRQLLDWLTHQGWQVMTVGAEMPKDTHCGVLDLRGRLTLGELTALLKTVPFFIGPDSGPAHIAAALGTRCIIFCSGTNIAPLWFSYGPHVLLLSHRTECAPCALERCPYDRHECMSGIGVPVVQEAIERFFAAGGGG